MGRAGLSRETGLFILNQLDSPDFRETFLSDQELRIWR